MHSMKRFLHLIVVTFMLLIICVACETGFDTTAPYQDITVVYGLLDPKDSMQYIKINKAFLSEDNVLRYAMMEDSNSYPFPLDVTVEEYTQSGAIVRTFAFDTTTVYNKEPGQFYYPEQVVYRWQKPNNWIKREPILDFMQFPPDTIGFEYFWLDPENRYRLLIRNPQSDKLIHSETLVLKDVEFTRPQSHTHTIRFVTNPQSPREFAWRRVNHAGKYEFEVRFNFRELDFGSNDTIDRYVTLFRSSFFSSAGGSEISVYFSDDRFFTVSRTRIPYDNTARESQVKDRFSGRINLIVSAAEEQFAFYLQVNEPSTSIIQEKPQYSNIDNGIGIFSSRIKKVRYLRLHSESLVDLQNIEENVLKFRY
jgi:hypothetical protein